ncbi:MAG: HAD family hydrolase [Lachnospiraceae bacterium]|nr:HAD family hydrolase [Lachnospiraceae bacterium]
MIDVILFDLDGTLLKVSQEAFTLVYYSEIKKLFAKLGFDDDLAMKAINVGVKAMLLNDGSEFNKDKFWKTFAEFIGIRGDELKAIENECNRFYRNEFGAVKQVIKEDAISKRLVRTLKERNYSIVLATNPLFPISAVTERLEWIGLEPADFIYITHYANSKYCKPGLEYYQEIMTQINKSPAQCIMIGNSISEDMCAAKLGMETFLVTDYLENENNSAFDTIRHGSLEDLEVYLMNL